MPDSEWADLRELVADDPGTQEATKERTDEGRKVGKDEGRVQRDDLTFHVGMSRVPLQLQADLHSKVARLAGPRGKSAWVIAAVEEHGPKVNELNQSPQRTQGTLQFGLSVPADVHRAWADDAAAKGLALNTYIATAIELRLGLR